MLLNLFNSHRYVQWFKRSLIHDKARRARSLYANSVSNSDFFSKKNYTGACSSISSWKILTEEDENGESFFERP